MQGIKDKINKARKSKDGKVLISNFGYLSLLQVASYLFPLITMPYLARVIGVEGFGKIAFASAIMVWFQTITDWGFNYTATRDVAKSRENMEIVSRIFSNVFWARVFLMIMSFILLLLLIAIIPTFKENQAVILISFLLVPGHILFPDWFFQAVERMKYITILNIASKFLFTIAVFVFIKEKSDYLLQPLFTSLGFVVSGIIALYLILVKWKIRIGLPHFATIAKTIKESTDVFINNLMPNLYNSFSTILLGFWGGQIATGKLDAGGKIVGIAQQFMSVLSRTFYPFLSRRIDKHGLYTKINVYLSLLLSVFLFVSAPILIKLFFTEEFYDSIVVLQILSFSIVFLALSNIYGTNYMIIQGYEKELRNITIISSIIGFLTALPLVFYYSYIGAALTITITRGILGLSIMFKSIEMNNKKVSKDENSRFPNKSEGE